MTRVTLLVCGVLLPAAPAAAGLLWDNGDTDGGNGASQGLATPFRATIDDFIVPDGPGWRVNELRTLGIWDSLPPGSGWGYELWIRPNEPGDPHDGPGERVLAATVTSFEERTTGRTWFDRAEVEVVARFDPIDLAPRRHWIEMHMVGPEDFFQMSTRDFTLEPFWLNYEDFGGVISTRESGLFELADGSWTLAGESIPAPGAAAVVLAGVLAGVLPQRRRRRRPKRTTADPRAASWPPTPPPGPTR